ncbi:unnamed protein product, partial [Amoebophrya sp. A25]
GPDEVPPQDQKMYLLRPRSLLDMDAALSRQYLARKGERRRAALEEYSRDGFYEKEATMIEAFAASGSFVLRDEPDENESWTAAGSKTAPPAAPGKYHLGKHTRALVERHGVEVPTTVRQLRVDVGASHVRFTPFTRAKGVSFGAHTRIKLFTLAAYTGIEVLFLGAETIVEHMVLASTSRVRDIVMLGSGARIKRITWLVDSAQPPSSTNIINQVRRCSTGTSIFSQGDHDHDMTETTQQESPRGRDATLDEEANHSAPPEHNYHDDSEPSLIRSARDVAVVVAKEGLVFEDVLASMPPEVREHQNHARIDLESLFYFTRTEAASADATQASFSSCPQHDGHTQNKEPVEEAPLSYRVNERELSLLSPFVASKQANIKTDPRAPEEGGVEAEHVQHSPEPEEGRPFVTSGLARYVDVRVLANRDTVFLSNVWGKYTKYIEPTCRRLNSVVLQPTEGVVENGAGLRAARTSQSSSKNPPQVDNNQAHAEYLMFTHDKKAYYTCLTSLECNDFVDEANFQRKMQALNGYHSAVEQGETFESHDVYRFRHHQISSEADDTTSSEQVTSADEVETLRNSVLALWYTEVWQGGQLATSQQNGESKEDVDRLGKTREKKQQT